MAEKNEEKRSGRLQITQKTSILGTDKEGNTTYKLSFFEGDKPVKPRGGMEVYSIEVIDRNGRMKRYEMFGEIPDGDVKEYYENGVVMMEKSYFDGQKNGSYKLFFPSGELWKEGRFSKDQIIRLKTYSEAGTLVSDKVFAEIVSIRAAETEVFYKQGREIARWVHAEDGTVKRYGDVIDGNVKYYVGKTLKEEHLYDEGVMISIKKFTKEGKVLSEKKYVQDHERK